MEVSNFVQSLDQSAPPEGLSTCLEALWYDAKGDWDHAHQIVQDDNGTDAAWIHAYLHRKQGDEWNAGYWYRRAGKEHNKLTLEKEWEDLVTFFLDTLK